MSALLKIILIIATCFASTFLLVKFTGVLSIEQIENWLVQAKELSPIYVGTLVVLLLFADLFIAVPTLTISILSGYFLGYTYGSISALTGIVLSGVCGYSLSRYYGDTMLQILVKDEDKRNEAISIFNKHGVVMILLSRAMPILPEVSACLSGMTRLSFRKFLLAWLMNSIPYVLIASYAGSISSFDNPKPAIYAAMGISLSLWFAWFVYHQMQPKAH